jgi:hypothetical protein
LDLLNAELLIAAILGAPLRAGSSAVGSNTYRSVVGKGPSTTQGKWLALCLAYRQGRADPTPLGAGPSFFKAIGVSARQGPRGYQDLVACRWIVQNRFRPDVNLDSKRLIHFRAIARLLEFSETSALELVERHEMALTPDNRLLLMALLLLASKEGRVDAASDRDLARLTGFTSTQVKGQMERLKQLGFVGGVVSGVTWPGESGKGKSYVYLNLIHPWWAMLYPGWRLIELHPSTWQPLLAIERDIFRSLMRRASPSELNEHTRWSAYSKQIQMYVRNLVLMQASESTQVFLAPSANSGADEGRTTKWLSVDLSDLVASIVISLRDGHGYPISRAMEAGESMMLYPPFGSAPLQIDSDPAKRAGPMLLTNIAMLTGGIDGAWLSERNCGKWVKQGIVTDGSLAPRKYGSRKATITESLEQYFVGINN